MSFVLISTIVSLFSDTLISLSNCSSGSSGSLTSWLLSESSDSTILVVPCNSLLIVLSVLFSSLVELGDDIIKYYINLCLNNNFKNLLVVMFNCPPS